MSCRDAEDAVSRQLEGRLPRPERSALRAHLRECRRCASPARQKGGRRGRALRGLGAISFPFPLPLKWLLGGGAASVGGTAAGGVAAKAAAIAATGVVVASVGYRRSGRAKGSSPFRRTRLRSEPVGGGDSAQRVERVALPPGMPAAPSVVPRHRAAHRPRTRVLPPITPVPLLTPASRQFEQEGAGRRVDRHPADAEEH